MPREVYQHHLPQLRELMARGVGRADLPDNQKYNRNSLLKNPPEVKKVE